MEYDLSQSEPRRLAELIDLDETATGRWRPDELAQVLQHQLNAPLLYHEESIAPFPRKGDKAMRSFGQLLTDPAPPLDLLRLIKDFAKASDARTGGPLPSEVAMTLYYAAILAALTRRGDRISELSDPALRTGTEWVLRQPWLPVTLRPVFEAGVATLSGETVPSIRQAGD